MNDMAKKKGGIKFTILPLTPDLWPALEDLFGKSGASNGCCGAITSPKSPIVTSAWVRISFLATGRRSRRPSPGS